MTPSQKPHSRRNKKQCSACSFWFTLREKYVNGIFVGIHQEYCNEDECIRRRRNENMRRKRERDHIRPIVHHRDVDDRYILEGGDAESLLWAMRYELEGYAPRELQDFVQRATNRYWSSFDFMNSWHNNR